MIITRDRHILYVDDTEEQRYAMRRILEGVGFHVLEAGSGSEALRILYPASDADRSDLPKAEVLAAILDVKLPDMSGYDLCRTIKNHAKTASLPILQISASFADPSLRAAGLSGGADAYVAQPVHPAELLALVEALIRSRDSEKTLRFQAEVSARLTASIDYQETLRTIERAFVPHFADACYICLQPKESLSELDETAGEYKRGQGTIHLEQLPLCEISDMPEQFADLAVQASTLGEARVMGTSAIATPLEVGRRRLGALVFVLNDDRRRYTSGDVVLAKDLGARSALALQNALLYTAQQAAQAALVQSEKLAAAGRLSAAMAHEINNPLESITNLIYLIDTSAELTPTLKGYTQEALSELSRLTHIARQSLGFYRELTGPAVFDLNESIDETLAIYGKRFDAKWIRIEREFGSGLTLKAVKGEIRQVISNLLVNALEAMPVNGTLRLETGIEGEDQVVLRMIDNGSGIPPETLKRIFDPFFTTRKETGTGLGLWVSDNIVTKHGGTIEVTTSVEPANHGTTFEVTLPRMPVPQLLRREE